MNTDKSQLHRYRCCKALLNQSPAGKSESNQFKYRLFQSSKDQYNKVTVGTNRQKPQIIMKIHIWPKAFQIFYDDYQIWNHDQEWNMKSSSFPAILFSLMTSWAQKIWPGLRRVAREDTGSFLLGDCLLRSTGKVTNAIFQSQLQRQPGLFF